jgi:alpha-glucosidase (family GH31 glycosyl hydrolase)
MLGFEAQVSAEEGNVGLPYVSHDIGSFHGQDVNGQCGPLGTSALSAHLPDDLYARWVALGTFQPLDRLHSDHGDRLPWEYGAAADAAATGFLRLREALNPYIYSVARVAYDPGIPIACALYLQRPEQAGAYQHPQEYTFGPDLVVEPVTTDGDPAPAAIWVPPGTWIDYFTGQRFRGPSVKTLSVPLSQMPVLVRAGAVIPTEPYQPHTPAGPWRKLVLTAYGGGNGSSHLYDDAGEGFGYTRGQFGRTTIVHGRVGAAEFVVIGRGRGHFPGALRSRAWVVRLVGVRRPRMVRVNHRRHRFTYDRASRTLTVDVGSVSTRHATTISAAGA